ncbi:MAG: tRNA lysidine(34) synthetase TilS [Dongiaceae bacterium]
MGAAEFAAAMEAAAPFETAPDVAIAVSGGCDSMALALLARDWVSARGGRAIALTVDHGLRTDSAAEARLVGKRLRAAGIEQHILRWKGPHPASGVQAAAREARYALLAGWCRQRAVLHLLLAHQRDDQAETLLMRLAHGSGTSGMAAMAAVSLHDGVRLLRPLLALPRARLAATLACAGVDAVDDPSNRNPHFERVRWRRALGAVADADRTRRGLAAAASAMGDARAANDRAVADLLAGASVRPEGYLLLPPDLLAAATPALAQAALLRCLLAIGGDAHPPRREGLERLLDRLRGSDRMPGRTLGGCRVLTWRGHVLICREAAALPPAMPIRPKAALVWDRRFRLRLAAPSGPSCEIGPLGAAGRAKLGAEAADRAALLPGPVRTTLPALYDRRGLAAVPHLGWRRGPKGPTLRLEGWQPRHSLAPAGFRPAGESCFIGLADYLE